LTLAEEISNWIAERVKEAKAEGVVFGLSGGVDSACVAVLCQRVLGNNALGLILPYHSQPEDVKYADLVAEKFGIKTVRVVLANIYDDFLGRLPKSSNLVRGNLKPRLRMATLYYFANLHNYLVVGTGNKSELTVGYFTKYGDGAADILPLGGLLKTDVRKLARELDIPEEIIKRMPSAGLWDNQTDEGELGLSYEELDKTILAIETNNLQSVSPEILRRVKDLIQGSNHKREPIPIFKKPRKIYNHR